MIGTLIVISSSTIYILILYYIDIMIICELLLEIVMTGVEIQLFFKSFNDSSKLRDLQVPDIDERTAVVLACSRPSSACEGERLTRTLDGILERARVLCHTSTAVDERKDTHPRG